MSCASDQTARRRAVALVGTSCVCAGLVGPPGPQGSPGPFSQALANKILVTQAPDPAGGVIDLEWSTGDPSNNYVPYGVFATTTTLAPIDPSGTGTGWRFSKTYPVPHVSTNTNPLVSGSVYTILAVGTPALNWVAMGAAAATINTTFTYNGTDPSGGTTTVGTVSGYPVLTIATSINPLVIGSTYTILNVGNPILNWVAMGAAAATVNTQFTYNGTAPAGGTVTAGTASAYPVLAIATGINPLVTGSTYTIINVGNPALNWVGLVGVGMGALTATVNTQFTYNGTAPSGGTTTPGTVAIYPTTKISWYALNALYGASLPTAVVPPIAIKKKNLSSAWFLIKMNSNVALQGSFSIQIETYAYQYGSNTTNDYTGRWAYSLPLEQGVGFNANSTTNITVAGANGFFPRLRTGFTYLLYAGDISPSYLLNTGLTFSSGGAGLFAPSQISIANTLLDPYNLYTNYPHLGLTSSSYVANAVQPSFPNSNYTDQGDVEVASIYLNTSSTSPPSGAGQSVMDFNVMAFGYSGLVESTGTVQTFSYTTQWV